MTEQANDIQWYIAREGKQHGPLSDIEMRTFVAHSYLRQGDLIWRPGMPEWQPAPMVFPAVFQPGAAAPAPAAPPAQATALPSQQTQTSDFDSGEDYTPAPGRSVLKRLAIAAGIVTIIGGGAFAVASYREPLLKLVSGGATPELSPTVVADATPPPAATEPTPSPEAPQPGPDTAQPAATPPAGDITATSADASVPVAATTPETQTAALNPAPEAPAAPVPPPSIEGSQIDARLQKIPAWILIKKDYPDWYIGHIAAAEKLAADKKPENEIAAHLAQGVVALRRQHAEKALSASPEKLRRVAVAFLDHLKALRAQSVSACYGFISKGESSPAVVQSLQTPEKATAFNAQAMAIFDAISEGTKTPVKNAGAAKGDYDLLIKELSKLGWKDEDLQVFSNPRLLAKREPEQVCKMVQEWFTAHLAVSDKNAQNRLLFETLKPVVSG